MPTFSHVVGTHAVFVIRKESSDVFPLLDIRKNTLEPSDIELTFITFEPENPKEMPTQGDSAQAAARRACSTRAVWRPAAEPAQQGSEDARYARKL